MAPVTDNRSALIVAHGSPSSPEGPEQVIRELAGRVQALLPDWSVSGATLAGRGTLEAALRNMPGTPVIYPFFMSDGWFVNTALPKRLQKIAGSAGPINMAAPLGLDPAVAELCLQSATEHLAKSETPLNSMSLILAAHGSPSDPRPRLSAERVAKFIGAQSVFHQVCLGFVDEAPFLSDAARIAGPALCLPFFAMSAGHVTHDIPEALQEAGFTGLLADPVGAHDKIPSLVAAGLSRATLGQAA